MNSKLISLIAGLIGAVASFFITREYFPNPAEVLSSDSTSIVLMSEVQKQKDSLSIVINKQESVIDSLNSVITKKPKIIIRCVPKPFPVIVRKDSIIYRTKDSIVYSIASQRPTIQIAEKKEIVNNPYILPSIQKDNFGYECIIIGKKDKTVVKLNPKFLDKEEALFIYNGEDTVEPFVTYFDKKSIKKKIKFNTSSVYVLLITKQEKDKNNIDKLIKNKNKI